MSTRAIFELSARGRLRTQRSQYGESYNGNMLGAVPGLLTSDDPDELRRAIVTFSEAFLCWSDSGYAPKGSPRGSNACLWLLNQAVSQLEERLVALQNGTAQTGQCRLRSRRYRRRSERGRPTSTQGRIDRVVRILQEHPGTPGPELAAAVGIHQSALLSLLHAVEAAGHLLYEDVAPVKTLDRRSGQHQQVACYYLYHSEVNCGGTPRRAGVDGGLGRRRADSGSGAAPGQPPSAPGRFARR